MDSKLRARSEQSSPTKENTMSLTREHKQSLTVTNVRDFNIKVIDVTQANMDALFEFACQLATVKTPSDIIELWTEHTRKQFERLTEQSKELTVLGQKVVVEMVEMRALPRA
jgi:hypothetical protein